MKHLASRLLFLIVIGAVINVAVTWALAIWTGSVTFDAQLTASLRRHRFEAEGRSDRVRQESIWIDRALRGAGLDLVIVKREQPAEIVHLYRAGWPFRAMQGESRPTTAGKPEYAWAVPLSSKVTLRAELVVVKAKVLTSLATRVVPLRPVWPGFLGNTVLYTVVAVGVIGCAWLVRRAYRRWRGRCIGCGYDLRGDLDRGCPECGDKRAEAVANGSANPESGGIG